MTLCTGKGLSAMLICPYCLTRHMLRKDDCQTLKEPKTLNPTSLDGKLYICGLCAAAELIAKLAGYSDWSVRKDIERQRKQNAGKIEGSLSLSPSASIAPSVSESPSFSPSPSESASPSPSQEPEEYEPSLYITEDNFDTKSIAKRVIRSKQPWTYWSEDRNKKAGKTVENIVREEAIDSSFVEKEPEPESVPMTPEEYITTLKKSRKRLL